MLVAIDTSTVQTGLACYDESGVVGECAWYSGREHSTQLLPQLDMLLHHLGRSKGQIAAVAVALGPGSWSGLRVGMSTAKGLALARSIPIIGIGTLDALAYQHGQAGLPIHPLIRLGRDRFATATFADQPPWQRLDDYRNVTLPELYTTIEGPALFCGDIDAEVQATLQRELHGEALFPRPAARLRQTGYLAELAWLRWQAGDVDDHTTLEPIYLGHPVRVMQS